MATSGPGSSSCRSRNSSTVASWLRLLIKSLIDQGEFYWDDAFAYINDEALELVRQYPVRGWARLGLDTVGLNS